MRFLAPGICALKFYILVPLLAESTQMVYYISSGIKATVSNISLHEMTVLPSFSTLIGQEEITHKVHQVSAGMLLQAQSVYKSCFRRPGRSYGRGERDLKLRSSLLRREMFCRFPLLNRCGGLGKLKRRRGNEAAAVFHEEDRGSNEPLAEAEDTRVSPNLSSGDKRIFIFGFGYTSCALASYLKNSWKVSGTCRSEEKRAALEQSGYSAHMFNSDNDGEGLRDESLRDLQEASHWLISVPPVADFDCDPVLTRHLIDLNQIARKGNVCWIGYLSSTAVYGDWQGDWVDEESIPRPVDQRALARLGAEESWLNFGLDHGVPVHIFRLGGIYGPGRSAIDTILQNRTLSARQRNREKKRFTSRIHVADICQTVLASMRSPDSGRIYNLVDNDPASRMEVLSYALDLLNNQEITSQDDSTNKKSSAPKLAVGRSNSSNQKGEKRVSNKRIKLDLRVKLLYPTYRQGLKAILEDIRGYKKVT